MGAARWPLARTSDIGFWKLSGSGTGEGFTPVPNTAVYAILATWPDHATAQERVAAAPVYQRYRAKAAESWSVFLTPTASRGHWAGVAPFEVSEITPGPHPRHDQTPHRTAVLGPGSEHFGHDRL